MAREGPLISEWARAREGAAERTKLPGQHETLATKVKRAAMQWTEKHEFNAVRPRGSAAGVVLDSSR